MEARGIEDTVTKFKASQPAPSTEGMPQEIQQNIISQCQPPAYASPDANAINDAPAEENQPEGEAASAPEAFEWTLITDHVKARGNYLSQVVLCWGVQMALCALLGASMLLTTDEGTGAPILSIYPNSQGLVIARFACGIILHMQLQNELCNGLRNMKFAISHHYRFDNPVVAFMAGFLQATSIFVIEIVNFIVILTSASYLDVVMNFMALAVIAEFDDKFFDALGSDSLKDLLEDPAYDDLYMVTRTSSRNCSELNAAQDDTYLLFTQAGGQQKLTTSAIDGQGLCMRVSFLERGPLMVLMRAVYKLMRVAHVSVWFYFLPFIALLGSYMVPFYYQLSSGEVIA